MEEGGEGTLAPDAPAGAPKPGAKKRGRPPKTAYMAGAGGVPNLQPNVAAYNAAVGATSTGSLVGARVDGVVDGSFDVGYFLTVRIGSSTQARLPRRALRAPRAQQADGSRCGFLSRAQLVRAIVFRPEMCVGGQVRHMRAAPVPAPMSAQTRSPAPTTADPGGAARACAGARDPGRWRRHVKRRNAICSLTCLDVLRATPRAARVPY